MRIRDILQTKGTEVVVIAPDSSVRDLVALLREHNLGAVIVSTDGVTMAGIVSERDVVRHLATDADVLSATVDSVMTQVVHTCHPEDSVESLMSTMTDHRIRHLPCSTPTASSAASSASETWSSRPSPRCSSSATGCRIR